MYDYFFSKTELVFQIMFGKGALFFLLVSVFLGRTGKITIEELFFFIILFPHSFVLSIESGMISFEYVTEKTRRRSYVRELEKITVIGML